MTLYSSMEEKTGYDPLHILLIIFTFLMTASFFGKQLAQSRHREQPESYNFNAAAMSRKLRKQEEQLTEELNETINDIYRVFGQLRRIKILRPDAKGIVTEKPKVVLIMPDHTANSQDASQWEVTEQFQSSAFFTKASHKKKKGSHRKNVGETCVETQDAFKTESEERDVHWNNEKYPDYQRGSLDNAVLPVGGKGTREFRFFSCVLEATKNQLDVYGCPYLYETKNITQFAANKNETGVVTRKGEQIWVDINGVLVPYPYKEKVMGHDSSLFGFKAAKGDQGETLADFNILKLNH